MNKQIQITLDIRHDTDKNLTKLIGKKTGIDPQYLTYQIIKKSLDCRSNPVYHYDIIASANADLPSIVPQPFLHVENSMEVIIVGAGPAGLFCALKLLQKGLKPVIIERGKKVEQRKKDVALICQNKDINPESNYCFGEGGAGTFSDGKLYTRSNKRGNINEVLQLLVHFGADKQILYTSHPHIGTDVLSKIIKNIRQTIEHYGGEYKFETKVEDLILKADEVIGVTTSEGEDILAKNTVLACGHSAKEMYQLFSDKNWSIEAKPFAMGIRIEHPQKLINDIQYHNARGYKDLLPAAEYSLAMKKGERGIFSFCMCPGGIIIPTVENEDIMVVNGMSDSKREGKFANSALVVSVNVEDSITEFGQYGALSLMHFQQKYEKLMYYQKRICPAQRVTDFLNNVTSSTLAPTSYKPGLVGVNMKDRLPDFITNNLKIGLTSFNRKMRGFITDQSNIIGLESRTSSPVKILRDKITLQHIQLKHLYPCGEGAGYAGGITSCAIDGINVANKIAELWGV